MENQYREEDSLKRELGQFANLRGWLGKKAGSVFEGGGGGVILHCTLCCTPG